MRIMALGALWLGSALMVAAASAGDGEASKGSHELHEAMAAGMEKMHSMKLTGNPDLDYAAMMIEHHQQAIAMSRAALEHGSNAELKDKAREIIAVSEKDIGDLEELKAQVPR